MTTDTRERRFEHPRPLGHRIWVLVEYESTATDVLALGTEGPEETSIARLWNGLLASP